MEQKEKLIELFKNNVNSENFLNIVKILEIPHNERSPWANYFTKEQCLIHFKNWIEKTKLEVISENNIELVIDYLKKYHNKIFKNNNETFIIVEKNQFSHEMINFELDFFETLELLKK